LGKGGSRVYTQVLRGVQGGFFTRDIDEISSADRVARNQFAGTIHRAIDLMASTPAPNSAVASVAETRVFSRNVTPGSKLQPVPKSMPAPPLRLEDLNARSYRLGDHDDRVVLINFWATWCRPCVEEIPSLHRLRAKIVSPRFEIITVNVGEDRQRIAKFIEQVPIQLPLLLDHEGIVSSAWKVYVYPSSYLLDRDGLIRFAYQGALEWDSPENITIIQNLLKQP
jgi:thiol-disulfide isomerase/thioredoxin